MKRLAAFAAILAIVAVQSVALADGETVTLPASYTGSSANDVKLDASGYSTVLITKDAVDPADQTIVYVNQADNVYDASADFLLKSNPDIGKYKVLLGSGSGLPKETYFYVGASSDNASDVYMSRLRNAVQNDEDDTWNIGYFADVNFSQLNGFNSLKVGYYTGNNNNNPVYLGFAFKEDDYATYSGSGEALLLFQLNNVPDGAAADSVAVYLSAQSFSSSQGN